MICATATQPTLAKAGAHPKVVQERLGHHSVAFTLDRHGHLFPSMQRDAADAIGKLIARSEQVPT
jgi:integrase